MHAGTVQWFDDQSGVGAIETDDGPVLPVSRARIDGGGGQSLVAGEAVRFDVHDGPDGPEVERVYTR
ncbi:MULTISPECIES: cold shock domain-containing protein [Pseudonocardia]|nr:MULTISPECIES: cold shock domain-containing protein [Pseudonocardia]